MSFNVSLSGLQGAQKAMDAVQQNIANVSTPDYKKLDAMFTAMDFSGPNNVPFNPGGVKTDIVTAGANDPFADKRLTDALGNAAFTAAYNDGIKQLADGISTKNAEETFSAFMNSSQDLMTNTKDPVKQEAFKLAGQSFSTELKGLGDQFTTVTRSITAARDFKQIQLTNLQQAMSQLTAQPTTDQSKAAVEAMARQVSMLTNSINGYNEVISKVIPPITSMYSVAAEKVVLGSNESYGQIMLDVRGGFNFDATNIGDVKKLTEWGSQAFNQDMGVINTNIGAKANAASMVDSAAQAAAANQQKAYDALTGVDITEQMVKMSKYKNMYDANAKAIQVQNEMLGTLLNIKA